MHKSAIGTALFLVLAATSAALGQTWSEGSDAGDLPHTAQVPTGVGDLITIEGVLDFGNVDMYQIHLTGGGTFSALATRRGPAARGRSGAGAGLRAPEPGRGPRGSGNDPR